MFNTLLQNTLVLFIANINLFPVKICYEVDLSLSLNHLQLPYYITKTDA